MKYNGSKKDIGVSKVQGLMDLKTDLRGWRLKGVESLKSVDPLFSDGISEPSHIGSASFQFLNENQPRDEVFEQETFHYVTEGSKVPSWILRTQTDPDLNKSKVHSQRDTEQVNFVTELYPDGETEARQYIEGEQWATGSKRFQTEDTYPAEVFNKAKSKLSKNQRFRIDPKNGTANAFYGKPNEYKGSFDFPGGVKTGDLEYNKSLVDEELGLIPFCITTITPSGRTYLNFSAHLDSYDDSYDSEWTSTQYVGRAEKFWGYTGFNRSINLSFKALSTNPQNLANLYSKLNRLVGATAPSYDSTGLFMRGTLASLTIGDLLRNQTGFIKSVKLSWQQDYLWELGPVSSQNPDIAQDIADMYSIAATNVQDGWGQEYYRIPQILDVSLSFTPIEHGTVREDYNAYFVFDPKELTPTETGTPEAKEETKQKQDQEPPEQHTIYLSPDREMRRDSQGNVIGMESDRRRGIDPLTRRPIAFQGEESTGIPFNF